MELTRRDAAAALAALGASGGVALGARVAADRSRDGDPGEDPEADGTASDDETVRETLTAVASVVYPSDLAGVDAFVETFLAGRLDDSAHAAGVRETVAELNHLANSWHGAPVADLDAADRDRLLREVGADAADEDPDGTTAERVRYYVVNELLLALYASPTGGELVGIENPQGHPGGAESYQRGPP
ncbi:hypothetical protein C464_00739 [Halorubrum coriense DSM 10284]|uniref:Gluconate 2-dehydrogenase subunit 3 family protein n=1 Tax=Halorubrum coriense DSM 10284 TaxID=1227466 RepID=M0EYQ3_9EURY|nr:gluconate 2-dehydrogenase subunit 3 family protein [Halorubrum coriense]ELZ51529.1 hypothetical protein C464_00739 [Halorubrum coriense DSM 10284]